MPELMPALKTGPLRFALALLAFGCCSGAVRADDFEWESWQDDASRKTGAAVQLMLHMPETDNIRFQASCRPGGISAVLGYDTGRRAENSPVSLSLSAPGYHAGMNGAVHGTGREVGLSGVRISPGLKDPFWAQLEEQSVLEYRIGAEPPVRLALTGSGEAVRKFVRDCQAMLAAARPARPAAAPPRPAAGGGGLACEASEHLKSRESKIPVTVNFVNLSDGFRGLTWVDFKGQRVDFASIDRGKSYRVKTYVSHIWMLTDGPGNCIEMFTPQPGQTRFEVRRPSPAFGPGND